MVTYLVRCGDQQVRARDRATRAVTSEPSLSVYLAPERLWIIPERGCSA